MLVSFFLSWEELVNYLDSKFFISYQAYHKIFLNSKRACKLLKPKPNEVGKVGWNQPFYEKDILNSYSKLYSVRKELPTCR